MKCSIKFGWEGLKLTCFNDSRKLGEITLSKDPKRIFEFLGYNYDRYLQGFDTEQEIFDFIINGKFFNEYYFKYENLNHIDKKRNKKRPDYNRFLAHINENSFESNQFNKDDSFYLIQNSFPEVDLKAKLVELRIKDEQNRELNTKFNGKLIMNVYPDLKGKELGYFITEFQKSFEDYREFGISHSAEEIMIEFNKFYEKEKGS